LDISFNRFKALPPSMSSLTGLAALNLAYNPLGCFPEVLCSLTSLRELNMDQTGEPQAGATLLLPLRHVQLYELLW
jgi:Leucine-rich repeat (LRR) protein